MDKLCSQFIWKIKQARIARKILKRKRNEGQQPYFMLSIIRKTLTTRAEWCWRMGIWPKKQNISQQNRCVSLETAYVTAVGTTFVMFKALECPVCQVGEQPQHFSRHIPRPKGPGACRLKGTSEPMSQMQCVGSGLWFQQSDYKTNMRQSIEFTLWLTMWWW